MSARKITDTKLPEDNEQDSGFLSGPIDRLPGDSGELSCEISDELLGEFKSDEKKVPSVSAECEEDSGVVVLTEDLSSWCLSEPKTMVPTVPSAATPAVRKTPSQLPPLSVLFEQDDDGDTQLHIAAIHGCEEAISTLIHVCPNVEWFNKPNDDGQTALHLATMSGNAVVTRMLVIAGASLTVRDRRGETPLHKATTLKNVECIKALLNPVKELPLKTKYSTVLNQKNYNGQACVHLAAAGGHIETLQALVYYGADVNCRENLAGWSPLHIAAHRSHAALAQFLLERCGAELRARDYGGRAPRRLARADAATLRVFEACDDDSDDSDYDEDIYDDNESIFEKLQSSLNQPLVA